MTTARTSGEPGRGAYAEAYRRSLADPEGSGARQPATSTGYARRRRVLDASAAPMYSWFTGGVLNTCYNALDRHVIDGRAEQPALIYDSPVTGTVRSLHLRRAAGTGRRGSVGCCGPWRRARATGSSSTCRWCPRPSWPCWPAPGSVRCTRSSSAGSHRTNWPLRIDDARPKVVVSASCGIEPTRTIAYKPMLDAAIAEAEHAPEWCVILQRPQLEAELGERDLDWATSMRPGAAEPAGVRAGRRHRSALHPLHLRDHRQAPRGSCATTAATRSPCAGRCRTSTGSGRGTCYWAASDVGWVVGHSYIVYAPLLTGATTVLYEGKPVGTPDAGAFWRVIEEHKVNALFTAPTAFRAIKREDPEVGAPAPVRRLQHAHPVPGRGAAGPRHLLLGVGGPGRAGRRPLVADRDRVGDLCQPARSRTAADQGRVAVRARPGIRRPGSGRARRAQRTGRGGCDLHPAAAAPRLPADAVAGRRALRRLVPDRLTRAGI